MPLTTLGEKEYYLGIFFKVQRTEVLVSIMRLLGCRPTGTRLSSTVGFMECIWLVLTMKGSRGTWRNTSLALVRNIIDHFYRAVYPSVKYRK